MMSTIYTLNMVLKDYIKQHKGRLPYVESVHLQGSQLIIHLKNGKIEKLAVEDPLELPVIGLAKVTEETADLPVGTVAKVRFSAVNAETPYFLESEDRLASFTANELNILTKEQIVQFLPNEEGLDFVGLTPIE